MGRKEGLEPGREEGQEEWADNASITEPIPLGSYATKGKNAFSFFLNIF